MFNRSILIPSLIACAIGAPLLLTETKSTPTSNNGQQAFQPSENLGGYMTGGDYAELLPQSGTASSRWDNSSWTNPGFNSSMPNAQNRRGSTSDEIFRRASAVNYQNAPMGLQQQALIGNPNLQGNPAWPPSNTLDANNAGWPQNTWDSLPDRVASYPTATNSMPAKIDFGQNQFQTLPIEFSGQPVDFSTMTPDFGAAQTIVFAGDANGPDLSGPPLEFMPIADFREIFRFEITPAWVKNRWQRVSTSPGDTGLHGLRVALVTGTNSWDLHGSLTYFFDNNQKLQRISFRGWAGDASRLIQLLTQDFGFQQQPANLAGFYLAGKRRNPTGGLLMKDPTVIYRENPVQRLAIVLEVNNPQGNFSLSNDVRSLVQGSQTE